MAVNTTENTVSFACDGSKTDFDFPYKITGTDTSVLVVTLWEDATSTPTVLAEDSGAYSYSVSAPNNNFKDGGTVSTTKLDGAAYIAYAWAVGYTITIERIVPYTQPSEFAAGGLDNKALEQTFDNLEFQIQQLDKRKSIHGPPSDATSVTYELPGVTARLSKVLGFDASGNVIAVANVPTSGVSATAFAETLLDDTTALAARGTLGVIPGIDVQTPPYNAKGDGVTDDTSAIQAAIDSGAQDIYIPEGTFLCNIDVAGTGSIRGSGPLSILKAYTTDPVITVSARVSPLAHHYAGRVFSNFKIDGNGETAKGIFYTSWATADDIVRVFFSECTRGIDFGDIGPIANSVRYCTFLIGDYGIYAKDDGDAVSINLNHFTENNFLSIDKCAIYLDGSTNGCSGNKFQGNWFETLDGFAIILKSNTLDNFPNRLMGGWFEGIATEATVTLDDEGVTNTRAIWLVDTVFLGMGGSFPGNLLITDSILNVDRLFCQSIFTAISMTGVNRIKISEAFLDKNGGTSLLGNSTSEFVIERPQSLTRSGVARRGFLVEGLPMSNNVGGHTNLVSIQDLTESSGASLTYQDAQFMGSGIRRVALSDDTEAARCSVTFTNSKSYIWTFSIRSPTTSAVEDILLHWSGSVAMMNPKTIMARGDRWTHYVAASFAGTTAPTSAFINFGTASDATFDISRLQLVEFPTLEAAEAFIHNQQFASSIDETVTTGSPTLTLAGTTRLDSSGGAITGTLADGGLIGGLKTIIMTDATTSSTISVAHHITSDPEVFTFAQVGDSLVLMWNGTDWMTILNNGVAV